MFPQNLDWLRINPVDDVFNQQQRLTDEKQLVKILTFRVNSLQSKVSNGEKNRNSFGRDTRRVEWILSAKLFRKKERKFELG